MTQRTCLSRLVSGCPALYMCTGHLKSLPKTLAVKPARINSGSAVHLQRGKHCRFVRKPPGVTHVHVPLSAQVSTEYGNMAGMTSQRHPNPVLIRRLQDTGQETARYKETRNSARFPARAAREGSESSFTKKTSSLRTVEPSIRLK